MNNTSVEKYYLYTLNPNEPIVVHMGDCKLASYFNTVEEARNSNCHSEYKNRTKYKVGKVRIATNYTDIIEDKDPPTPEERIKDEKEIAFNARVVERTSEIIKAKEISGDPLDFEEQMCLPFQVSFDLRMLDIVDEVTTKNEQVKN